ncbi:MAG: protein translocase subunit SecF [Treponema sp.]|nr:protein translocase subunit SecF [Treponema sp.]
MVQEVQFAPTAFTLTWEGAGNAMISSDSNGIYIIHSGVGIETRSLSFLFSEHGTVGQLTSAMVLQLEGLGTNLYVPWETNSAWLMRGALGDPMLGSVPHRVHYLSPQAGEIPIALVREIMEDGLGHAVVVQSMGQPGDRHFLIRVQADDETQAVVAPVEPTPGIDADVSPEAQAVPEPAADLDGEAIAAADDELLYFDDEIRDAIGTEIYVPAPIPVPPVAATPAGGIIDTLEAHFGQGQVIILRSDFVGSRFAGHLTDQIGILIAATLLLVLLYASIRFRLQYAVGAVLGIIHDGIIVAAFVVITRMEFNTITIAAILTILGYSTNNTIVVFDRIRENRRLYPDEPFVNILNRSLSETLNRTIITTVTTMLAVMSLFIFTTGAMQDFALALMVGMLSGVYTTTFIVTAFMNFWENQKVKKARKELTSVSGRVQPGKPVLSKA